MTHRRVENARVHFWTVLPVSVKSTKMVLKSKLVFEPVDLKDMILSNYNYWCILSRIKKFIVRNFISDEKCF